MKSLLVIIILGLLPSLSRAEFAPQSIDKLYQFAISHTDRAERAEICNSLVSVNETQRNPGLSEQYRKFWFRRDVAAAIKRMKWYGNSPQASLSERAALRGGVELIGSLPDRSLQDAAKYLSARMGCH